MTPRASRLRELRRDGFAGLVQTTGLALLRVNGQAEASGGIVNSATGIDTLSSISPMPSGFTVPAGTSVEVDDQSPGTMRGRAWGYISKQ